MNDAKYLKNQFERALALYITKMGSPKAQSQHKWLQVQLSFTSVNGGFRSGMSFLTVCVCVSSSHLIIVNSRLDCLVVPAIAMRFLNWCMYH